MKELEKHPKGWNSHSFTLKNMGYKFLGWRNDGLIPPADRKFHVVPYNERGIILYICPETKEYYMFDSEE